MVSFGERKGVCVLLKIGKFNIRTVGLYELLFLPFSCGLSGGGPGPKVQYGIQNSMSEYLYQQC